VSFILTLFLHSPLLANPVWGERIVLTQPNGTLIEGFVFGDEFHVRIESKEGYTLIRNTNTGNIEYAVLYENRLIPSGLVAGAVRPIHLQRINFPKHLSDRAYRIAEKRRKNPLDLHDVKVSTFNQTASVQTVTGTKRVFVVCVQFQPEEIPPNQWSTGLYPTNNFNTRLFDSGPSSISLTNFYKAQSYGLFWPEGYTYPNWLTLPDTASEYKEDGNWITIIGDALDAIKKINPLFDFTPHCNDGDMDIVVIWAGTREAWATFFWPKMGGAYLNKYGFRVRYYNVVNERLSTGDENTSISTFCHEYGHMIGAPDLYDYSDFQNKPIGYYCIMGTSDYRLGFCGFIKSEEYGWISANEIVNGGNFHVDALGLSQASNPRLYKIFIDYPLEYLLLENRNNGSHPIYENFPTRRSGLLITHVDENYSPAACLPNFPFYGVEAICAELNPQISSLNQYKWNWNKMVWAADFGHIQIGPSYPDDKPAGSSLKLSSSDNEENVIYRNTQGHRDRTDIHITDISTSGNTMSFSVSKKNYTLTLNAGPGGTTNPSPGSHTYDKGRLVTVSVLEDPYYSFIQWTGDVQSIQPGSSFISVPMDSNKTLTAHFQKIHKPLDVEGERILNRSLAQSEYINILKWKPNPLNAGNPLSKYRIYQLINNQWHHFTEVSVTTTEYWQRNVEKEKVYQYKIIAKNARGREGEPAYCTIKN
jgi:M6 family metalloprotease-like protein